MLISTMQFLVEKLAVNNQLRKTCSVALYNFLIGNEEQEKNCAIHAQYHDALFSWKISGHNSTTQKVLSSMMQHQFGKEGAEENLRKTCSLALYNFLIGNEEQEKNCAIHAQYHDALFSWKISGHNSTTQKVLSSMIQHQFGKGGGEENLRNLCSVALCNFLLGSEE